MCAPMFMWLFIHSNLTGIWGTTLTEDTKGNRELYVKTTLRELLVYIVFLVDICLCKYGCGKYSGGEGSEI